jgi:hypothetical protein
VTSLETVRISNPLRLEGAVNSISVEEIVNTRSAHPKFVVTRQGVATDHTDRTIFDGSNKAA